MGVIQKNSCSFCQRKKDTTFPYMLQCVRSRAFWADFVGYLKEKCDSCAQMVVDPTLILFGHSETGKMNIGFHFISLRLTVQNKQSKATYTTTKFKT